MVKSKTVKEIANIIQYEPEVLLNLLKEIDPNVKDINASVTTDQYRELTKLIKRKKQSTTTQSFVSKKTEIVQDNIVKKTADIPAKTIKTKETKIKEIDTEAHNRENVFVKEIITDEIKPEEPVKESISLNTNKKLILKTVMTPKELSHQMGIKEKELIKALFKMNIMVTSNQSIDQDTAQLVAEELGFTCVVEKEENKKIDFAANLHDELKFEKRPPVVTIMGHVDHGKTSLLDYIRTTKVQAKEAGGITQHIGAYQAKTKHGLITFLDTPGHEAFTSMRARGAKVTDIVIIIIAADDGVMPQTEEAIKHAKAAEVPVLVAINKCDKPNVDLEKVKTQLAQHDLTPEEWGGETMIFPISAKTGQGIDDLLEGISINAELLDLKAPINGPIQASVIESRLDKGRGPVVSLLVQTGTLSIGEIVLADIASGRVRSMLTDDNKSIKTALPGMPIEVTGFSSAPAAGETAIVVENEKVARQITDERINSRKQHKISQHQKSLHDVFSNIKKDSEKTVLKVIVKGDVHGSIEAIEHALSQVGNDEASVQVISSGVGSITENDVNLSLSSKAILVGFNVRPDAVARKLIEQQKEINIFYFNIIYNLVDQVTNALKGLVGPQMVERIIGYAEVKAVFTSSTHGLIAGSMVVDGVLKKDAPIRVLRNDIVIYEGSLESLRHFQKNIKDAKLGTECGIGVKDYNDIKVSDRIEAYEIIEKDIIFE